MGFRIAPLLLIIFNCIFLSYALYNGNYNYKITIAGIGITLLAIGASRSHHYYSKQFIFSLYFLCLCCSAASIFLAIQCYGAY